MLHSQVYPRIGLKGLLIFGVQANRNINGTATYFICSSRDVSLRALFIKTGTKPKAQEKNSKVEKSSKI